MGFLSWLFRRRPELPILAWLDEDARRAGLVRAVQAELAAGLHVVVVAHFVDELVACGQALTAAGVPFVTLRQWTDVDAKAALSAPRVAVVLAKALPRTPDAASAGAKPGPVRVRVHAAELHVLADANRRVLDFAHALPAPAEAVGHASLTGPQLASFMTPTMREMMARLGMTADAPIDSPMVGRAVRNALAKLAAAATGDRDAPSLAQWLERNVPPQR